MIPRWIFYGKDAIRYVYKGKELLYVSVENKYSKANENALFKNASDLCSYWSKCCGIEFEEKVIHETELEKARSSVNKIGEIFGVKNDTKLRVGKILLSDNEKINYEKLADLNKGQSESLKTANESSIDNNPFIVSKSKTLLYSQKLLRHTVTNGKLKTDSKSRKAKSQTLSNKTNTSLINSSNLYGQKLMRSMSDSLDCLSISRSKSDVAKTLSKPEKATFNNLTLLRNNGASVFSQKKYRLQFKNKNHMEARVGINNSVIEQSTFTNSALIRKNDSGEIKESVNIITITNAMAKSINPPNQPITAKSTTFSKNKMNKVSCRSMAASIKSNIYHNVSIDKQSSEHIWTAPEKIGSTLVLSSVYKVERIGNTLILE